MAETSADSAVVASKKQKVDKIALLKEKLAQLPNKFELPSWAGDAPAGLHIDVMKDGKLIQKAMIDEKPCYLFGRNREVCDFALDHESASRLHAAIVWHKQLQRAFLIDCGSVHGTFVGKLRLEADKPTQVPVGTELHFGASTRTYIIRERPKSAATFNPRNLLGAGARGGTDADADAYADADDRPSAGAADGTGLSGLPEDESEIDNLTEFNTMHNRRVGTLTDILDPPRRSIDQRRSVRFRDQIDVINPEDVDPSIGRFRNLCSTVLVPTAKPGAAPTSTSVPAPAPAPSAPTTTAMATAARPRQDNVNRSSASAALNRAVLAGGSSVLAKLGLTVNIAPDIAAPEPAPPSEPEPSDLYYGVYTDAAPVLPPVPSASRRPKSAVGAHEHGSRSRGEDEPRKKKYAKEAWPGRHPPSASGLHS